MNQPISQRFQTLIWKTIEENTFLYGSLCPNFLVFCETARTFFEQFFSITIVEHKKNGDKTGMILNCTKSYPGEIISYYIYNSLMSDKYIYGKWIYKDLIHNKFLNFFLSAKPQKPLTFTKSHKFGCAECDKRLALRNDASGSFEI